MMILASWVLVAAVCCGVHSMTAPTNVNDLSSSHESSSDEARLPPPDKRILKYLLPSWTSSSESGMPRPTGQEGTKRGYTDRNFLRFGRGDTEKLADGENVLRFGRGDGEEYDDGSLETSEESLTSAEKRDRNFLRFGRNFLRFGRGGTQEFGHERSPVEFALGYDAVEDPVLAEKRNQNFLRFGRGKNFLRFGRLHKDNFLRFGRSVDQQTFCNGCDDDVSKINPSATVSHFVEHEKDTSMHISPKEDSSVKYYKPSAVKKADVHRRKRSAPMYYDYAVIPSHGPMPWAMNFQPTIGPLADEEVDDSEVDSLQEVNKRDRNFLRFGRDRNFLRFGKRDAADAQTSGSNLVMVSPVQYPRFVRAPTNNFLRFG